MINLLSQEELALMPVMVLPKRSREARCGLPPGVRRTAPSRNSRAMRRWIRNCTFRRRCPWI